MAGERLSSYLASRNELQGTKSGLHLGDRLLKVIEGSCDLLLNLAGLGPGGRVGSDLVKGGGRHGGRVRYRRGFVKGKRRSVAKPKSFAKVV